jgi:RHS repeat-associated protein
MMLFDNTISIKEYNDQNLLTALNIALINQYRYRGYRYDSEVNLYYLNSRYYNPETARFINADGIIGQVGNIQSTNMFAYCANNPVMYTDISGMFPKSIISGNDSLFKVFTTNSISKSRNQVIIYDYNNVSQIINSNQYKNFNLLIGFKGKLNWDLRDFESREDMVFSYSFVAGGLSALGIYGYFALTVTTLTFGSLAFGIAIIVGGFVTGFILAYIILDAIITID